MTGFMLDTNIVGHMVRGHPVVMRHVTARPMSQLFLSVITEAELLYGLAKRPEAVKLHRLVSELLLRLEVLPWDREAAVTYGQMRAGLEARGFTLGLADQMIAAHALSRQMILISNDQAFGRMEKLSLQDWTKP
ncbi:MULTISPECIES: type II toxin-antitoxin system VapC family toxin [unclassified Azospirillum]|uniref:type II toxin-antitoxin system VapC family toxin n=1 Tax=unclassified Azospirillum TaxID=2630922 RepID=UPI000B6969F7|nr:MULTISPECIES: type II toxin-antitoxin system VapC family toxin [unclassified Azospirillum]SNR93680.1 tRNA(fMet)-specific endonuclease VapC [Azospirillum sp. RU38E]SNS09656.1 tRNA(fMet)-specific endonuclease VapC [Azospirillum sp. RU37A]